MTVEVVVPTLRQGPTERLVASLALNEPPPDLITIVSNETQPFPVVTSTRLLRFASDEYAIGELDVALRQNCGIYAAQHEVIIIQGDDQVAPPSMVADAIRVLGADDYLWGNHRLTDFGGRSLDDIRLADPSTGVSREHPVPPAWHGYQSCYGGMLVARAAFLRDVGAFDMAFNGRHGSEDQQLGYRLMRRAAHDRVRIVEPPFSWHPIELRDGNTRARLPWLDPLTNGCGPNGHVLVDETIKGVRFRRCQHCPVLRFDDEPQRLFRDEALIPFRPEAVTTTSIWLTA